MKKKIIIASIITLITILALLISLYFYNLSSVSKNSEVVKFNIASGTSTKEVINNLEKNNLIRSKLATLVYVKLHNNLMIQAGTYELDRSMSTKEILNKLGSGDIIKNTITITFIEGKRLIDYLDVIDENFNYSKEDILKVINNQEYLKSLINKYDCLSNEILNSDIYYSLEGYLFPATYEFYKDSTIEQILEKMLAKTDAVIKNYLDEINESDYSVHEVLTMASIIENETMLKEDKPLVSQVIYKRLNTNMSLGMDVTTYYGVRKSLKEELTSVDIAAVNAYNTRRTSFLGLPVGPISNPSVASIEAALNPSDTDYVYFYAEITTGKLHFAKTYREFQNLIQKYS